ncbi:MAG TPA: M56 family metallopeptidase, partial [Gemmatimonadaceae bacterium]|nr:M56 family metallopeptidase [Gemmatimonadaceae bacterium]
MIAAWMMYALIVGTMVAIAARAAERVARLASLPTRWIWAVAMVVALGLAMRAPVARRGAAIAAPGGITAPGWVFDETTPRDWWSVLGQRARVVVRTTLDLPVAAESAASGLLRRLANSYVVAAWLLGSLTLAVIGVIVAERFRRARRGWPSTTIDGVRVLVAPETGPVVLGLVRPQVVVPRWLLKRDAAEQRMVVVHEAEHVRARDPLLLAAACAAAILAPWYAALWYMLSRLRLAIEVDCDARVLRAGTHAATYGAFLIDVAERALPLRATAPALAGDSSHLRQRIIAMQSTRPRFALLRGSAAVALVIASLLAACEANLPTPIEVGVNGATAQEAAHELSRIDGTSRHTRFWVDSIAVTPREARSLDPGRVAAIDVHKDRGQADVWIRLKAPADSVADAGRARRRDTNGLSRDAALDQAMSPAHWPPTPNAGADSGSIMIILNGVRSDSATLHSLDKSSIASVE